MYCELQSNKKTIAATKLADGTSLSSSSSSPRVPSSFSPQCRPPIFFLYFCLFSERLSLAQGDWFRQDPLQQTPRRRRQGSLSPRSAFSSVSLRSRRASARSPRSTCSPTSFVSTKPTRSTPTSRSLRTVIPSLPSHSQSAVPCVIPASRRSSRRSPSTCRRR